MYHYKKLTAKQWGVSKKQERGTKPFILMSVDLPLTPAMGNWDLAWVISGFLTIDQYMVLGCHSDHWTSHHEAGYNVMASCLSPMQNTRAGWTNKTFNYSRMTIRFERFSKHPSVWVTIVSCAIKCLLDFEWLLTNECTGQRIWLGTDHCANPKITRVLMTSNHLSLCKWPMQMLMQMYAIGNALLSLVSGALVQCLWVILIPFRSTIN